jgi:hypothetical protein
MSRKEGRKLRTKVSGQTLSTQNLTSSSFTRSVIESGDIFWENCPMSMMTADMLTIALARVKGEEFTKMDGLMDGKSGQMHGRLWKREGVGNISHIIALVSP